MRVAYGVGGVQLYVLEYLKEAGVCVLTLHYFNNCLAVIQIDEASTVKLHIL